MLRAYKTHIIRKEELLSNSLWGFALSDEKEPKKDYKMLVPSCWEKHHELIDYRGKAVYSTTFEAQGNVRVVFKGVSHTANIFVDGKFVKNHYNAYTPFDVVLTNLENGKHELRVEVDNSFGEESALHIENDYMTYGGITRGVSLEHLGEIYIKNVFFTPFKKDGEWWAKVVVKIENLSDKSTDVTLKAVLDKTEFSFDSFLSQKGHGIAEKTIKFPSVCEWNTETPNLYLLHITLSVDNIVIDDLTERVGFREIKADGNAILLNGRKIRIKGFNRHEDHPAHGCAIPMSVMMQDLLLIKDAGANSIRTCHYPNDELFLDLCDEMGFLVWEENHARGLNEEQMKNPNFDLQCENCIAEMITEHYNHPAIYLWGILNECSSDSKYGAECYKKQFEQINSLDSSRLTSFASDKREKDLCFEYPSVISNNTYPLWYLKMSVEKNLDFLIDFAKKSSGKLKPFIISEIGCSGIYGYRSRNKERRSEECQAEMLEKQIVPILKSNECSGVYIWQFCDGKVTKDWEMQRPRGYNNKGVVDEYRREKTAYYAIKRIFSAYENYFD